MDETRKLQERNALIEVLVNTLIDALPYVEMAEHDPTYKPGVVKKMVAQMRYAIDAASK